MKARRSFDIFVSSSKRSRKIASIYNRLLCCVCRIVVVVVVRVLFRKRQLLNRMKSHKSTFNWKTFEFKHPSPTAIIIIPREYSDRFTKLRISHHNWMVFVWRAASEWKRESEIDSLSHPLTHWLIHHSLTLKIVRVPQASVPANTISTHFTKRKLLTRAPTIHNWNPTGANLMDFL